MTKISSLQEGEKASEGSIIIAIRLFIGSWSGG